LPWFKQWTTNTKRKEKKYFRKKLLTFKPQKEENYFNRNVFKNVSFPFGGLDDIECNLSTYEEHQCSGTGDDQPGDNVIKRFFLSLIKRQNKLGKA